jgi:hypothetical protein
MLHAGAGKRTLRIFGAGAGGIGFPSFNLPLNDLGNGIVNTVPAQSAGSTVATFTRASIAWAKLASGLWGQVATGVARAHYLGSNTAVGAYGGYLSEGAGVQLVTPTAAIRDMTDASWVKVGITAAKTATGIDGVPNSASTLTCTAPNGTILQTLVAAASSRTYSVFMRRKTGAGTVLIMQGATTLDVTALINAVTYTRVQLNASVLNSAFGIQMVTSGDQVEADVDQFEALAATQFASSPMLTLGAARAADVLTYPSAGNVDFTQGTAYAELSTQWTIGPTGGSGTIALSATTTGRFLYQDFTIASTAIRVYDGSTITQKLALSDMSSSARKRASSWGSLGESITGDGLVPLTQAFDGTMGSGASIEIGHTGGANQWSGTIANVRIFPVQVSSSQLQAMTA